ncbi:MAG TPA: ATP-binding cassette domain-containing protein [Acidimicrobiales bacterium]|nr:ATP-binding cassette domain-containing protein [Acidimicrobiales bacterium]
MHDDVIEARALTKRYGKIEALAGLDLAVRSGRITALLGPNGAGKTTFVRLVATLTRPDAGTLLVGGLDVRQRAKEVRRLIGLAGQYAAVEEAMTGRENLVMVARLYGQGRQASRTSAVDVLERLGLGEVADRLVRTYSGGLRRRLDLGASLVGAPRLLLLDEPTTGLDPRSRAELWEAIRSLRSSGTDVLLTTQYLDEADHLADHVVIVDRGRMIAEGTPTSLKRLAGRDVLEVHAKEGADPARAARTLRPLSDEEPRVDPGTRRVAVHVDGPEQLLAAVRLLHDDGVEVEDIALRRPTLDEVFLSLTGPADDLDLIPV